jgi:hypothetical protein
VTALLEPALPAVIVVAALKFLPSLMHLRPNSVGTAQDEGIEADLQACKRLAPRTI